MGVENIDGRRLSGALAALGVYAAVVSPEQLNALDRDGYVVLPGVLTRNEIKGLRSRLAALALEERDFAGGVLQSGLLTLQCRGMWGRLSFAWLNAIMRAVRLVANKYVFRHAPRWKAALIAQVTRPAASPWPWGRLKSGIVGLFHTAARQEQKVLRIENLVSKGEAFHRCFTDPLVLALISRVLRGDLKLSSLNYRAANTGGGLQPLHVDWHAAVAADDHFACNTLWMLDDFTEENGATRVVPGSHRWGCLPADRPDHGVPEKLLVGTAGSVIVLNSHLWHSGTSNRTGRTRRVIQAYFVRRHCKPQLDQADFVTPQTLEALSEPAKALLFLPTEAKPQADLTDHGQAFRA